MTNGTRRKARKVRETITALCDLAFVVVAYVQWAAGEPMPDWFMYAFIGVMAANIWAIIFGACVGEENEP